MSGAALAFAAVVSFCLLGVMMLTRTFWVIVVGLIGLGISGYCIWWIWLFFSAVSVMLK